MSFWDFLNWLWGAILKVLDWFSEGYWTARSVINNVWTWIVQKATEFYNLAVTKIEDAKGFLSASIQSLRSWFIDLYNSIVTWVITQVTNLSTRLSALAGTLQNTLQTWVTNLIQSVQSGLQNQLTWLQSLLQNLLNQAISNLTNLFSPLLTLINRISELYYVSLPDTVAKLQNLLGQGYQNLQTFLSDPVGFTLAILEKVFVSFACYMIAKALGSTKESLPPPPNWRDIDDRR